MPLRLGASIILAVIVGLLIPVTAVMLIALDRQEKEMETRLASDHERVVAILTLGMKEPLWTFNVEAARPLFESIFRDPRVVEATVRDRRQGAFLLLSYPERRTGRQLTRDRVVTYGDAGPIGSVRVVMDTGALESEAAADRKLYAFTLLGQLVLSLLLIVFLLQIRLLRPLQRLMRESGMLARRELSTPFVWKRDDELGKLGESLEETRRSLQSLFEELEQKNQALERDVRHRARMTVELQQQHDRLEDLVRVRTTELSEAKLTAELASQAKSVFLAAMSHELRTPLNAILGYAQILGRDSSLSERQAAGLTTIEQSGEHLLTLINDILDLSKIEAGKLDLLPTVIDLPEFLRLIADIIRVKAEEKSLLFLYEAPADLPRAIQADEKRLRQVLLNLLGNAVRFSDKGHVALRVTTMPGDAGAIRIRFEIEDTGIGIAPAQMGSLFRPFEQAGDVHRRFGGTGLGLAISRQLVRLMSSDIGVRSRPAEGSVFWFEIAVPLAEVELASIAPSSTIVGYEGARKRALVVDDVPGNRKMMSDFLATLGFEVSEADDGASALEAARAVPPDLVLMDIVMPGMDGIEATRRMRADPALARVAIIGVSASTSKSDEERVRAAGANVFLSKPVDLGRLMGEIATLLELSWIHEPRADNGAAVPGPLLPPPRAELEALHRLAMIGNMKDIREHASHIASLGERYRPFGERLRMLAEAYRSKAILELVESFLKAA